jgi:hypothetical protein
LSFALLLLFAYGSTAEAIHTHGNYSGNLATTSTTAASDTGAASNSNTPAPRRSGAVNECLVCQFQQNLSSAEIFTPALTQAPPTATQQFRIATALFSSVTINTPHGRGPPAIS